MRKGWQQNGAIKEKSIYDKRTWSRQAVMRLGRYDLSSLRSESAWVKDAKVVSWCDEALASLISRESSMIQAPVKVISHERDALYAGTVRVEAYTRNAWVKPKEGLSPREAHLARLNARIARQRAKAKAARAKADQHSI